ncbi:MAG: hypothetical protein WD077_12070 [Bacteroidia bacterium]
MKNIKNVWFGLLIALTACDAGGGDNKVPAAADGRAWADPIEEAHRKEAWQQEQVLKTRIAYFSGEEVRFAGWMYMETNGSKSRFELDNGSIAVFDGEKAWVVPDTGFQKARFHLLTWPYFLAAPYKLNDPGSHLTDLGTRTLQGAELPAAKLTFDEGVGDTPDDWYIAYMDQETKRLKALAYIVTYGKPEENAEDDPHALIYDEFVMVNKIPVATEWRLWEWNEKADVTKALSHLRLGSISFINMEDSLFIKPENATEDVLPELNVQQQ